MTTDRLASIIYQHCREHYPCGVSASEFDCTPKEFRSAMTYLLRKGFVKATPQTGYWRVTGCN